MPITPRCTRLQRYLRSNLFAAHGLPTNGMNDAANPLQDALQNWVATMPIGRADSLLPKRRHLVSIVSTCNRDTNRYAAPIFRNTMSVD